jgi:hypothetical protein
VKARQVRSKPPAQARQPAAVSRLSGVVWSLVPLLCAGYTAPETLFYLIVTCGITSGAVPRRGSPPRSAAAA